MWLGRINHALGPLIGTYWRLQLVGDVAAIPSRGPLVVAANHSSYLDPWFIGMVFPRFIRFLVASAWYNRNRTWNTVFRAFGTVPVQQNDPHGTLRSVEEILARGEVLGIFPEGRVSADGRIQRFQSGVARVAARTGVPVLPVGIRGGFASLPRHRRIPKPVRVTVHVGNPVQLNSSPARQKILRSRIRQFNVVLEREIRRLSGQQRR